MQFIQYANVSRGGQTRRPTRQLFNEWNNSTVTMGSVVASCREKVPRVNVRLAMLCTTQYIENNAFNVAVSLMC